MTHRKQGRSVVLKVKPFLLLPLHRSGHGDFKARIYSVPHLDMDERIPRAHQLSFRIFQTQDVKEVLRQIKLRVDP
jgi:hypothetical protein